MKTLGRIILTAVVAACITAPAFADGDKPPVGSVACQLLLKRRLEKISTGTLTASLNHNRNRWEQLSPDQRDKVRRDALAFEAKTAAEQEKMIERHDALSKMSPEKRKAYRRRAKWLSAVVAGFTDDERKQLKAMTPDQRAKRLLERKAELIKQGKLKVEAPATQPTE